MPKTHDYEFIDENGIHNIIVMITEYVLNKINELNGSGIYGGGSNKYDSTAAKDTLRDVNGNDFYPYTTSDAVYHGLTNLSAIIENFNQELDSKAALTAIPTKLSELENDKTYQTLQEINTLITNALPTKLSQLDNDNNYQTLTQVNNLIQSAKLINVSELINDRNYQTDTEVLNTVTLKIAEVVAGADESFDTLKEIADWINTHADSASAMNTQIQQNKTDIATLNTNLNNYSLANHNHDSIYLKLSGGIVTGLLTANAGLKVCGRVVNSGDDEGIVVSPASNGYATLTLGNPTGRRSYFALPSSGNPFWRYNDGTSTFELYHPGKSGTISIDGHTHNYAGSASAGGSANSAVKLDTATAGSVTQPIYFSGGKPVACTYTLGKSVPSDAVFTDTNTWRGIQDNLTSTSTADSLSANQGRLLANGSARDSTKLPLAGGTMTGAIIYGDVPHSRIILRNNSSWKSGIGYDTNANECVAIWATNSVTRLRWYAGTDMSNMVSGTMMGITPDFEISKASGSAKGYIGGTEISVNGHTHNYAGSASVGGSANSLAVQHDNEINFTGITSVQEIYFNYRNADNNSDSGNTAITKYNFCNKNGSTSGVTINASNFTGNASTASKLATARTISLTGSITGSVSFDGSGDITINTSTNHTHDDRYYTESEIDTKLNSKISNYGASPTTGTGTAITQPGGDAVISIRTTNGTSKDVGIFYLSQDNAYIANSSDNNYTFGVFDTDLTTDMSSVDSASFVVLPQGDGAKIRGNTVIHSGNIGSQTVAAATKATQDSDGNPINSTYLKLSGGTMTGDINCKYIYPISDGSYYVGNYSKWFSACYISNVYTRFLNIYDSSKSYKGGITYRSTTATMYSSVDQSESAVVGLDISSTSNMRLFSSANYIYLYANTRVSSNAFSSSDEKVKTFTDDIDNDKDKLIKLFDIITLKSYRYKYATSDSINLGFSAQEIEQACKEIDIDPEKYNILDVIYSYMMSRGQDEEDCKYYTKFYMVSYNDLYNLSLLKIKNIEDTHLSKLNELEQRILSLENK